MTVAHYIPTWAVWEGQILSDSEGASAGFVAEAAAMNVFWAMRGFRGPKDIFWNPESIFWLFSETQEDKSPFDLYLSKSGEDFAVWNMHFKIGVYQQASANPLSALYWLIHNNTRLIENESESSITEIILRTNDTTFRQITDDSPPLNWHTAEHSVAYNLARTIRNCFAKSSYVNDETTLEMLWSLSMLTPHDYSWEALTDEIT